MLNMIEGTYMYYSAIKILEIKNNILRRKANLNSKRNYVNSQFTQFQLIGEKIFGSFDENYKKVNLLRSKRVVLKDGGSRCSIISFINFNRNLDFVQLSDLKNGVEKIIDNFPLIFKKKESKLKKTSSEIGVFKLMKTHVNDEKNSIVKFEK